MKKLLSLIVVLLSAITFSTVWAQEGSELEISGNVDVVSGWQRGLKNANYVSTGLLGDGLQAAAAAKGTDQFGFYVDQVELDLAKSFGENIRARADLDFSPHRWSGDGTTFVNIVGTTANFVGGGVGGVYVEQGYVTANVPAGNGIEFLVGRFNSGIGFDPIDRNELKTVSFSTIHRTLVPHNMTGARLGYQASDAIWFDLYVVNNLVDSFPANTDLPSTGANFKYSWGDEGEKSWAKISAAFGPEQATNTNFSYFGDLAANVAVSDGFWLGGEGIFRIDNGAAGANSQLIGGTLQTTYAFSDIWDGTLRYGFTWDRKGTMNVNANGLGSFFSAASAGAAAPAAFTGIGAKGSLHDIALATSYSITDGAKFILEARVDLSRPSGGSTGFHTGFGGQFAYSF
ncbi:MAG: outer membrane beta-barrel protein [Deltaproteobacteria bacterium]|nr:outer membrane beta-barrel protein [Deltaproteobacteria bacterium]